MCSNFTFLWFLTCEELVRCEESVPNPYTCEDSVPYPHTGEKNGIKLSYVKNGIKTHTNEEMVPNHHTFEKLVPNYHACEELVLSRTYISDKTVKNWNRMQNAADLEDNLSM